MGVDLFQLSHCLARVGSQYSRELWALTHANLNLSRGLTKISCRSPDRECKSLANRYLSGVKTVLNGSSNEGHPPPFQSVVCKVERVILNANDTVSTIVGDEDANVVC